MIRSFGHAKNYPGFHRAWYHQALSAPVYGDLPAGQETGYRTGQPVFPLPGPVNTARPEEKMIRWGGVQLTLAAVPANP